MLRRQETAQACKPRSRQLMTLVQYGSATELEELLRKERCCALAVAHLWAGL